MRWVAALACLSAAAAVVATVTAVASSSCERSTYRHTTANVERVDEPEDALRVYHDKARGVTCYESHTSYCTLSCVPDVWLKENSQR